MANLYHFRQILSACAARAREQPVTIGDMLALMEDSSFCFVSMLIALIVIPPVPLGPVATLTGITFFLLGRQLYRGQTAPVLPKRLMDLRLSEKSWGKVSSLCAKLSCFSARFTRRWHTAWLEGDTGRKRFAMVLMAGGGLQALPVFGAPFNDAIPALAIFCASLAQIEKDGRLFLAACGLLVVSAFYISSLYTIFLLVGKQALTNWF